MVYKHTMVRVVEQSSSINHLMRVHPMPSLKKNYKENDILVDYNII